MNSESKKAIVFGVNGYIGRHLAHFLEKENFESRFYDIQKNPIDKHKNYSFLDISDATQVEKIDFDVDIIFLFSGLTGTNIGFEKYEDFIKVNEIGLLNILNHMRKVGSKSRLVYPSTRLVYKGLKAKALKEDDEKEIKTIYALNKITAENILLMYNNIFGINFTILRICVPYGNIFNNVYSYGTIGFFLENASNGKNIKLYGDGLIKRTFTHIEDICKIIIEASQHEQFKNSIFNIGGLDNLSLFDAAKLIAHKFNVKIEFAKWPKMARLLESNDTVFNSSKLDSILPNRYKYTLGGWLDQLKF
jgi:UDP-glucose 4-epimerase